MSSSNILEFLMLIGKLKVSAIIVIMLSTNAFMIFILGFSVQAHN